MTLGAPACMPEPAEEIPGHFEHHINTLSLL